MIPARGPQTLNICVYIYTICVPLRADNRPWVRCGVDFSLGKSTRQAQDVSLVLLLMLILMMLMLIMKMLMLTLMSLFVDDHTHCDMSARYPL